MFGNSVPEFEDLLADSFQRFHKLGQDIGGLVSEQCTLVKQALGAQLEFIKLASQSQKPIDSKMMELLRPTSDLITQIINLRDRNRKDEHFNLLSSIAEGIPALGWVSITPTPAPYIKEMTDSAQFYTNKVLMAYKDKNPKIVDWAKTWIEFLTELQRYVRKNHTTGLVWNSKGNAINGTSGPSLPPPPPPPAGFFDDAKNGPSDKSKDDSRAALFASINQGTDITRNLKKVTADQQTHKNAALRQSGVVPDRSCPAPNRGLCQKDPRKLNPKLALEGKKWVVENQFLRNDLVVSETDMAQSVNVWNCNECLLTVKGKVNLITVNACKKFSIVFDNIVSVVEFINSQRIQAQANGVVPTITIDKVDGIQIYLGKESLNCSILSSKSSEINVSVMDDKSGDYVEHALPEQFKSLWTGRGFKTEPVEKA